VFASFYASATLLAALVPPDPLLYAELRATVPPALFQWQLAAFGGVTVLNVLNVMLCTSRVQYNCNVLLFAIHGVAFYTDLALATGRTPIVRSPPLALPLPWLRRGGEGSGGGGGGLFFPLRYVQWLHSTPTMIVLMALMGELTRAQLGAALAADITMILTGLAASWLGGPMQRALVLVVTGLTFMSLISLCVVSCLH
jgi:bacteriorhodopsin